MKEEDSWAGKESVVHVKVDAVTTEEVKAFTAGAWRRRKKCVV
jgi:hypothetical protein